MADRPTAAAGATRRFLTFRAADRLYALPAEEVKEVIPLPTVARVPQGPKSLVGLANLRGSVVPVASLKGLLGDDRREEGVAARAIVLDGASPVALSVDGLDGLNTVNASDVDKDQATLAATPGERLLGAFQTSTGRGVAKILDIEELLKIAFAQRALPARKARTPTTAPAQRIEQANDREQILITFDVAGQEYAFELAQVQEIIDAPQVRASTSRTETVSLGVTSYRETLLPLMSLRGLLGFPPTAQSDGREKVIVVSVASGLVGLVADRMRAIVRAEAKLVEALPALLAVRTGGEARVKAVFRGEGGRRLISILAVEQLFREDVMKQLSERRAAAPQHAPQTATAQGSESVFLVFRLAGDEFALPIGVVDEVAELPERITRLPKAPAFLEGVINVRGEVVPVIDQRRRFDMPKWAENKGRRLVILRTEKHRAGLIVDAVSEVLRVGESAIEPAPQLTQEITRLVHSVINLGDKNRLIMLLDPGELLTRAERDLLETFTAAAETPAP